MLNKSWTLHVENFAKIKSADVNIAPLIFFVGDNNSGKSYMMSLLWGILTYGKEYFPQKPSESVSYKKCVDTFKKIENRDTVLENSEIQVYIDWFNDILNVNKKKIVKTIFNHSVEIGKIEIRNYKRDNNFEIKWNEEGSRYSSKTRVVAFPKKDTYGQEEILRMNAYICWNVLMGGIAAPLYTPIVKGRRMGEPVYLPASRTGFMLTYEQLIDKSIQNSYSEIEQHGEEQGRLTMPYIDFLKLILKFDTSVKPSKQNIPIVDFLEKNMTKGKITVKKEYVPKIKYCPAGTQKELPLFLASSVVGEISPLLLLFKSNINFKVLIIEEPEAHLHPALQKQMARLIIRLMNAGIPVWITTHSDTILQHINNMIKLNENDNKNDLSESYGYDKYDWVNYESVNMYQFEHCEKEKSMLVSLESSKNGFVVPTFNNALEDIVGEVYAFQEDD